MKWIKDSKQRIWVGYNEGGIRSGMHVGISSMIASGSEDTWIPDVKRGWGMKRADPVIRSWAWTRVNSQCHGCYDRITEICVSWNKEPAPGTRARAQYDTDIKSAQFIGIHKSPSAVMTALKAWMLKDGVIA